MSDFHKLTTLKVKGPKSSSLPDHLIRCHIVVLDDLGLDDIMMTVLTGSLLLYSHQERVFYFTLAQYE